jgi:hypothetical protein
MRRLTSIAAAMVLTVVLISLAAAQTQEPKPPLPASPVAEPTQPATSGATTGVSGSSWQGPTWGVHITWDPSLWVVEDEYLTDGYDGLQIGTPSSTVFVEAYDGFAGDADACLADAQRQIGEREGVTEVVPLTDRPLPTAEAVRGAAQLFGITAKLSDGTTYRGLEFVECRTIKPGASVLELTWQTTTGSFNEDFPLVQKLLATVEVPGAKPATPTAPRATPVAPMATPVA